MKDGASKKRISLNGQTMDMTEGAPWRILLRFSVPLMFGGVFQLMYNTADTVVLGRFVGADALAAMGTAFSANMLISGFVYGMTKGVTVQIAGYFGAGDQGALRRAFANALRLCVFLGAGLGLLSFFGAAPLMRLLGADAAIRGDATLYLQLVCGLILFQTLYDVAAAVLNAVGDSKTPLYFLIGSSLLNIVLDLLFVLTFSMGVPGAALATVIAQFLSAAGCLLFLFKKYAFLRFSRAEAAFDRALFSECVRLGLPLGLKDAICSVGMLVMTAVINHLGKDVMAAYTIGNKIEWITMFGFAQLTFAFAVYASQNHGACRYDRIERGMRDALLLVLITCLLSTAVALLFNRPLVLLFIDASETPVIAAAMQLVRIEAYCYIPLGLILLFNSAMQGLGYGRMILLSAGIELVSKIGVSVLLSPLLGCTAVWLAAPVGWVLGLIPTGVCFFQKRWMPQEIPAPTR